jgi:hypothetical protein
MRVAAEAADLEIEVASVERVTERRRRTLERQHALGSGLALGVAVR